MLGEEIDRVEGVRDLVNADLRGRQWAHVELSEMSSWGVNLAGANYLVRVLSVLRFAELT